MRSAVVGRGSPCPPHPSWVGGLDPQPAWAALWQWQLAASSTVAAYGIPNGVSRQVQPRHAALRAVHTPPSRAGLWAGDMKHVWQPCLANFPHMSLFASQPHHRWHNPKYHSDGKVPKQVGGMNVCVSRLCRGGDLSFLRLTQYFFNFSASVFHSSFSLHKLK